MGSCLGLVSKKELDELRKEIDKNNDGVITKSELEEWTNKQNEKKNVIINLKKDIKVLKEINKNLENKIKQFINENNDAANIENKQQLENLLSEQQINIFVEQLLDDHNINIQYLPDYVEKQLYRNILMIIFGFLRKITSNSSFNIIGHELKLSFQPINDK